MNQAVHQQVVKFVSQIAGKRESEISNDAHLIEDLGFDSPDLAEVADLLQDCFRVRSTDICQPGCLTIEAIEANISRALHARQAA